MEDDLEAFRREWLLETKAKKKNKYQAPPEPLAGPSGSNSSLAEGGGGGDDQPPPPRQPPLSPKQQHRPAPELIGSPPKISTSAASKRRPSVHYDGDGQLADEFEAISLEAKAQRAPAFSPKTALDHYALAVQAEKEGRLNDALTFYKNAFRLDPDVDRAYHRATHLQNTRGTAPQNLSKRSVVLPELPTEETGFKFERPLHLGPDYTPTAQSDRDGPSSTTFYINKLAKSFAANPWVRSEPQVHADAPADGNEGVGQTAEGGAAAKAKGTVAQLTPEEALDRLGFIPADEEKPLPLATLPREVLLLVMRHLSLSAVLPPAHKPPTEEDEHDAAEAAAKPRRGGRRLVKRTLKEEQRAAELELELDEVNFGWKMDVEALERFARSCRAARILTLDRGIWRDLVLRAYVPPHQLDPAESALSITQQHHAGDFRRCFLEHNRIRLDGCFISVVTYFRQGQSEAWHAPTHLITFYRYLRFYPSGLVVSFLTTDAPAQVVRRLNPALRAKGCTFGRWRLRGDLVECWGLEDPATAPESRRYSFRMTCRLKSTTRGRMNKLEMLSLATEHKRTGEVEDLSIRPTKPFLFSKVAGYGSEDL